MKLLHFQQPLSAFYRLLAFCQYVSSFCPVYDIYYYIALFPIPALFILVRITADCFFAIFFETVILHFV